MEGQTDMFEVDHTGRKAAAEKHETTETKKLDGIDDEFKKFMGGEGPKPEDPPAEGDEPEEEK